MSPWAASSGVFGIGSSADVVGFAGPVGAPDAEVVALALDGQAHDHERLGEGGEPDRELQDAAERAIAAGPDLGDAERAARLPGLRGGRVREERVGRRRVGVHVEHEPRGAGRGRPGLDRERGLRGREEGAEEDRGCLRGVDERGPRAGRRPRRRLGALRRADCGDDRAI